MEDGTALNTFDKLIYTIGKDIFGIRRSKNNRLNYRGNSRKENIQEYKDNSTSSSKWRQRRRRG